jgi:adenosylmethionine-8-amino-7-oxononanoate aminotransferase
MQDTENMTPFPLNDDFSSKVKDAALECGVNVLCNMGFAGMHKIDTVAMTPPFIITEGELAEAVNRLKKAIQVVSEPYLSNKHRDIRMKDADKRISAVL